MKKIIIIAVFLIVAKWWLSDPTITIPSENPSVEEVNYSYIVKYSAGASSSDNLPMLVALHGNGDTMGNFYDSTLTDIKEPARIILIKAPIPYGRGTSWPGRARGFDHFGKPLNEVVEILSIKFATKGKPVLMGFSGGAMMAFYQALKFGDSYSTIIPVSGMMSEALLGNEERNVSANVSVFHGKSDNVVSFSGSEQAISLIEEEGGEVDFTPFKGGHHGIFREMKTKITKEIEYALLMQ